MVGVLTPPEGAPSEWTGSLTGYAWSRLTIGRSDAAVYRLNGFGKPDLIVKTAVSGIAAEAARLRWLTAMGIPAPEVHGLVQSGRHEWMLMTAVPGTDLASSPDLRPQQIVTIMAEALRHLHAIPVAQCSFTDPLPTRLVLARQRLAAGTTIGADAGIDAVEFAGLTPAQLADMLATGEARPYDPVVTHGDPCLPNLMVADGAFTGFIDCGSLAVADRWHDLALAAGSVGYNLGAEWIEPFFAAYRTGETDSEKLRFYRLLELLC